MATIGRSQRHSNIYIYIYYVQRRFPAPHILTFVPALCRSFKMTIQVRYTRTAFQHLCETHPPILPPGIFRAITTVSIGQVYAEPFKFELVVLGEHWVLSDSVWLWHVHAQACCRSRLWVLNDGDLQLDATSKRVAKGCLREVLFLHLNLYKWVGKLSLAAVIGSG